MLETIQQLGALQIDSISVVERSHHIVLWSRLGNHQKEWLHELHATDRAIFEYWVHACGYAPIELYPYFRRTMLSLVHDDSIGWSGRARQWIVENREMVDGLIEHVREHGAVSSSTFAPPEGADRAQPWAWYGNKPTNRALELLWTSGVLAIDRREKFQRWYDLTERVHPDWDDAQLPTVEEERLMLGERALRALGIMSARWLTDYFRTWGSRQIPSNVAGKVTEELVERGIATPTTIRDLPGTFVVHTEIIDRRFAISRTTLLSPFDSLVWHRPRTKELFDFDLLLEAYTPAEKRRYGYFSLPILYRDMLVGRLDPKAERKTGRFVVKALHIEPSFVGKDDERFYAALAATLRDFAVFNGCDPAAILIERSDPDRAAACLVNSLASA
jgi:uncharacterized protein YcaQ